VRSKFTDTSVRASRQTDIRVNWGNPVVLGTTGRVRVYENGSLKQTINANDTFASQRVSELLWVSGNYLYIDITTDFAVGSSVYVTIEGGVVKDACGYSNPAVTNPSTIAFTVDPGPTAVVSSLAASGTVNEEPLTLTFDRPVVGGSGNVVIYDSSNNVVASVSF
jgi:hypothetical protein